MFYNFISSLSFSAMVLLARSKTYIRFFGGGQYTLSCIADFLLKGFIISNGKGRLYELKSVACLPPLLLQLSAAHHGLCL